MLDAGDKAPDFRLPADDGSEVSLSDYLGKKVVLYFYPRDNTPGCTTQACDLRDNRETLEGHGAVVLGVSPDPVRSHVKFRDKFGLNFPLLSDEDRQVAKAYGVWKEKSMYGKLRWGVERSTFIIDEEGVIQQVWRRVKAKGHGDRVREALGLTA
jgi:peroxiredoxin Q/BCP